MWVSVQSSRGDAGTWFLIPGMKAQVRRDARKRSVRRGMEAPVRRRRLLSGEEEVGLTAHESDAVGVMSPHRSDEEV